MRQLLRFLSVSAVIWFSGVITTGVVAQENIKVQDGFGAQLWVVRPSEFFATWHKPQPPLLNPLNTVKRNEDMMIIVLFTNPGKDESLKGLLTYDLLVTGPNGEVIVDKKSNDGWKRKTAPPTNVIEIADESTLLIFEGGDPSGTYTIDVVMTDHISGIALPLQYKFELE